MAVYPLQDAASKTNKTYSKIVSKYPNSSKQADRIKELKKENKRLKRLLEKAENKYKAVEKYIQVLMGKSDFK